MRRILSGNGSAVGIASKDLWLEQGFSMDSVTPERGGIVLTFSYLRPNLSIAIDEHCSPNFKKSRYFRENRRLEKRLSIFEQCVWHAACKCMTFEI